jgi:hypothetical protein
MISLYLQVQLYITLYAIVVMWLGYISYAAVTLMKALFCPRQQPPPEQPQPQLQPIWAQAGWYRVTPTEVVPLFHHVQKDQWTYYHKGHLVYPSDAAVGRRGFR